MRAASAFRWIGRGARALVMVLLIVVFFTAFFAARPHVPDHGMLVIEPSGALVEQVSPPSPGALFLGGGLRQSDLHEIIAALDRARTDERIALVALRLDHLGPTPPARLEEARAAIRRFRESGKKVIAIGANYSQGAYYLASAASEIWLHPMGMVALTGMAWRRHYLKDALDALHIEARLFRAGRYKSFGEPLVRNGMSEAAREEAKAWLNGVWRHLLDGVAKDRGIEAGAIERAIASPRQALAADGSLARLAKRLGLVDRLLDGWHADRELRDLLGVAEKTPLPQVGFRDYVLATGGMGGASGVMRGEGRVGVIVASGAIGGGERAPGEIGSASLAALIRRAMNDDSVRAVVLRLDSPGGDALASEDARQALLALKQSGKPLVVSMSGAAASGGYWIASAADEIWAWPTTLTGSIVVFGIVGNVSGALERLGVHLDGVATSKIAGLPRADAPLPDALADVFQQSVDRIYRRFVAVVAEGRGMTPAAVERIAQGRVWTGEDALRLGRIDHLGGLDAAIRAAARRAGLDAEKAGWRWIRRPVGPLELVMQRLAGRLQVAAAPVIDAQAPWARLAGSLGPWARALREGGVQAWIDLPAGI